MFLDYVSAELRETQDLGIETDKSQSLEVNTVLSEAELLINNKKYESAYKLLDYFDSENEVPEIYIKKIDICINYFVQSLMHEIFALTDLEEDQDIMEIRGQEGSFSMYVLNVSEVMNKLLEEHPDNGRLYKAFGDYYFDAY
jgi:hypothetical protein